MNFIKELEQIGYETNPSVLDKLANSENFIIVERVAKNTHLSLETLKRLSKSSSHQVLLNIANNPSTPNEVLLDMYIPINQYQWVNRIIIDRVGEDAVKEYYSQKQLA